MVEGQRPGIESDAPLLERALGPVFAVAEDGMANGRELDANLMGESGEERHLHQW